MRLWLKMKILSIYGSQSKFARACGKTDDWVSKVIMGKKEPNEKEKKLIISKLNVDYGDDLFLQVNNSTSSSGINLI